MAVLILLAAFFGLGVISSALAYSPRHAFTEWASFWLLLMLAAGVAGEIASGCERAQQRLRCVLMLAGLACAVYVIQALVFYGVALAGRIQPTEQALTPGFDNFRFLNHIQTLSLPLLGLLTTSASRQSERRFWWTLAAMWWMLLFVSGGRGAVIAVLAAVVLTVVFWRRPAFAWGRVLVTTAIAGFVAYGLLYVVLPWAIGLQPYGFLQKVAERTTENPASGRLELWTYAWRSIVESPWFGNGPMHYAHLARDMRTPAHPHNWMLQIAFEWGVPALCCAVGGLFVILQRVRRLDTRLRTATFVETRMTLVALSGTALAVLIDGLVSGVIVMPLPQLWLTLFIGCAWGWLGEQGEEPKSRWSRGVLLAAGVISVLAVGMVVAGSFPEVLDIPAHEAPYRPPIRDFFAPRWWRNGYF